MTALRTTPISQVPVEPKATEGTVVLLHACDGGEASDRRFVDLSVRVIREALGAKPNILIHTSDAESFAELGPVVRAPGLGGSLLDKLTGCSRAALGLRGERFEFKGGFPALERANPNLIVGVGGGYLRTANRRETIKASIEHLPQVIWAGSQPVPSLYLPQSIGPFPSEQGRRMRDAVERVDHVFVRDDRTASLFAHHEGLRRTPDLALIDLVERLPARSSDVGRERIYLAGGRLPSNAKHHGAYAERLVALRALLPDVELLLSGDEAQDRVGTRFYRNLGWQGPLRTVPQALADGPSGVMISVGIDPCFEAMMAGWPCLNLAVERKDFGIFADLNLRDCVSKASCFDPQYVAQMAGALRFARQPFWARVEKARERCTLAHAEMVGLIARAYRQGQKRRHALA